MEACFSASTKRSFLKAKHYKAQEKIEVQIHVRFRRQRQRSSQFQCNYSSIKEVKKSLETLRRAAPSIFTDEMIDNIHQIIAKRRLNEKIKSSLITKSSFEQQRTVPKMKEVWVKHEDPNISFSSSRRSKVKNAQTKKNRPEYSQNYSAELQPFWKEHHLKRLIDLYCQGKSLAHIKDILQSQYPQIKKFFTFSTIRCISLRTIRAALRKFEKLIEKFEDVSLPRLFAKFDAKMMQAIKFDSAAQHCRIKILEFYVSDNVTSTLLRETIEILNSYLGDKFDRE